MLQKLKDIFSGSTWTYEKKEEKREKRMDNFNNNMRGRKGMPIFFSSPEYSSRGSVFFLAFSRGLPGYQYFFFGLLPDLGQFFSGLLPDLGQFFLDFSRISGNFFWTSPGSRASSAAFKPIMHGRFIQEEGRSFQCPLTKSFKAHSVRGREVTSMPFNLHSRPSHSEEGQSSQCL